MRRIHNMLKGYMRKNRFFSRYKEDVLTSRYSTAFFHYKVYSKDEYTIEDGCIEFKDLENNLLGVFIYSYTYNLKKIRTSYTDLSLEEILTPFLAQLQKHISALGESK